MDLQRAEPPAEFDLLRRGDALIAEHQHVVVQVRAVKARERVCIQRLRQRQADDFRTQGRVEGHDLHAGRVAVRVGRALRMWHWP